MENIFCASTIINKYGLLHVTPQCYGCINHVHSISIIIYSKHIMIIIYLEPCHFMQSCSKFSKEQKLFYGHLMKMNTNSSNLTHKADLGLFPTLRKFSKSWNETSLLDRF